MKSKMALRAEDELENLLNIYVINKRQRFVMNLNPCHQKKTMNLMVVILVKHFIFK